MTSSTQRIRRARSVSVGLLTAGILALCPTARAASPTFSQEPRITGSGKAGAPLTCTWGYANPDDVSSQQARMVAVRHGQVQSILVTGSASPLHYTPNGNEGSVGCQVRAYGRTEGGGDPPTADAVSPLVKITPPLYIAGRGMKPQKLSTVERSGFAAQGECNRACSLKLELVLAAPDARRLGIGQGATTIGSGRGPLRAGKSTVRARVSHLAKLNHAGFVRLTLRLSAVGKDGTRAPAIVLTKLKIRFHQ